MADTESGGSQGCIELAKQPGFPTATRAPVSTAEPGDFTGANPVARATSHWVRRDDLAHHGAVPTADRVVFDGKYVTAAGVSAGIDMALTLVDRLAGRQLAEAIQCGIEYDPHPQYDAGAPEKVDPAIVAELLTYKDIIF